MKREITIYTDGSSLGNPGPGGWGVLLLSNKTAMELGGRDTDTTNNRMELTALIRAFDLLSERGVTDYDITVYADSKYVLDGITQWIHGWKKKNWKKSDGKPVLNVELWKSLDDIKTFLETDNKIFFEHVPAHTGHQYNERVDDIARLSAEGKTLDLYDGTLAGYIVQ